MAKLESTAFPYKSQAKVTLVGRLRTGGQVTLQDGKAVSRVKLSPRLFAALTYLIWQVKPGNAAVPVDASSPGFVTKEQMAQFLARVLRKNPEDMDVNRVIHLLRDKLASTRRPKGPAGRKKGRPANGAPTGPMAWAHDLVEHQDYLGYRLSTAPENLTLVLLAETRKPTEDLFPTT